MIAKMLTNSAISRARISARSFEHGLLNLDTLTAAAAAASALVANVGSGSDSRLGESSGHDGSTTCASAGSGGSTLIPNHAALLETAMLAAAFLAVGNGGVDGSQELPAAAPMLTTSIANHDQGLLRLGLPPVDPKNSSATGSSRSRDRRGRVRRSQDALPVSPSSRNGTINSTNGSQHRLSGLRANTGTASPKSSSTTTPATMKTTPTRVGKTATPVSGTESADLNTAAATMTAVAAAAAAAVTSALEQDVIRVHGQPGASSQLVE
ncbi:unnamed protein product, partial [Protopolystoma xenopodis]